MTADTIECPFCAEIIKAKAKKCRHCGEFLESGLTREAVLAEFETHKAESASTATAPKSSATVQVQAAAPQPETKEPPAPVALAGDADKAPADADPLEDLYQKLAQMPASAERDLVIQTLRELATETQKEEAEKEKIEDMVKTVVQVLPDVAEVTINTIINPASGLMTLVQKVAQHAKGDKEDDEAEQAPEPPIDETAKEPAQTPAEAAPAKVEAEKATEALKEVHEQLEKMSDSPEKELVAQTLAQLETEPQDKVDAGDVADVIEGVAEALPDVAEATLETVQELAKGQSKKSK